MPSTIVTTIGSASANSYVDTAAADAYFDDQLNVTKWTLAVTADKQRALLMAAKRLQIENWLGNRVTTIQALAWPRVGVQKVDGIDGGYAWGYGYLNAEYYLPTEIPQRVKDAQCEFALSFLSGGAGIEAGAIESFNVDGLSVKMTSESPGGVGDERAFQLIAGLRTDIEL